MRECRLEELRAQAQAEAKAAAQAQVEEQVKKMLEAEREAYRESLTEAIVKERIKTEDQLHMVQLYVSKAPQWSVRVPGYLSQHQVLFFLLMSVLFLPSPVDGSEGKTRAGLHLHDSPFPLFLTPIYWYKSDAHTRLKIQFKIRKRTERNYLKCWGVYGCEHSGFLPLKAKKLEAQEKELKNRDALYQEHVAKLEAKVSVSCLFWW